MAAMNAFLALVRCGKNEWWRYLLGIVLILSMWQIVGALPTITLLVWVMASGGFRGSLDPSNLPGVDPTINFVVLMLASVFFILGIYLAVRFVHRRPFLSLVTPARTIAWGRLFQGFGVWLALAGLTSGLEALLYPGRYAWTFDPARFVPFVFLALVLVPIQTSAEELFFRGYLLQGIGLQVRNIWMLSAISGSLFMLPHLLNPEAATNYGLMALYYFSMGVFLAYLTLRDGRLELALGIHAANNLFSALVANYPNSVMPSPSLFTVGVLDAVYSVPVALAAMAICVLLLVRPLRAKVEPKEL
jgi:membrane protease YdiL (CAAX protease family)